MNQIAYRTGFRHSGEGRNPVMSAIPVDAVFLQCPLDSRLRGNDGWAP